MNCFQGIPCSPVAFSLPTVQVQSLLGELKSHKASSVTKKKQNNNKKVFPKQSYLLQPTNIARI